MICARCGYRLNERCPSASFELAEPGTQGAPLYWCASCLVYREDKSAAIQRRREQHQRNFRLALCDAEDEPTENLEAAADKLTEVSA